jgi:hypothetical protein
MNKEKLLKLADGLENYVKDEWWNFSKFWQPGFPEQVCGTAACAIGWAPALMDDPRLKFANNYIYLDDERIFPFQLGNKYFELSHRHSILLFENASTYKKSYLREVTRLDVAAKIREYVASDGALFGYN